MAHVDLPHPLASTSSDLDPTTLGQLADRLETLTRSELARMLGAVPVSWPASDFGTRGARLLLRTTGAGSRWKTRELDGRNTMRFVYSIVRFVPDPARGEFVNVGAIVGSEESSEWQYRQIENPMRARALDERQTLDAVWSFLDRVGRQIDDFERAGETLFDPGVELSEAWMERLYVDQRNVVQLSRPTPMVAASADEAMDRIFDDLVVDPARRRHPFQKKHAALAAVRAAYRAHSVEKTKNLRERVSLQTDHHRERFDFAVTNGKVVQLTHTWSFQLPDQEQLAEQVKAWGWTVRDVRGGVARLAPLLARRGMSPLTSTSRSCTYRRSSRSDPPRCVTLSQSSLTSGLSSIRSMARTWSQYAPTNCSSKLWADASTWTESHRHRRAFRLYEDRANGLPIASQCSLGSLCIDPRQRSPTGGRPVLVFRR